MQLNVGLRILAMRLINEEGLKIIKNFEGFAPTPYVCPSGYWTVGYGHVIKSKATNKMLHLRDGGAEAEAFSNYPKPITTEQALELLKLDVTDTSKQLDSFLPKTLNENQFSSLVSFAFNIGVAGLKLSTLNKKLQQGKLTEASLEFSKWVFGTSQGIKIKLIGLIKRREAEKILFLKQT